MNKDVMLKWTKALRSGKYAQGANYLCRDFEQWCCLGVLCDLYNADHPNNPLVDYRDEDQGIIWFDNNEELLPTTVKNWAGLKHKIGEFNKDDIKFPEYGPKEYTQTFAIYDEAGKVISEGLKSSLAEMNDNYCSFNQIANFIEQNYEAL